MNEFGDKGINYGFLAAGLGIEAGFFRRLFCNFNSNYLFYVLNIAVISSTVNKMKPTVNIFPSTVNKAEPTVNKLHPTVNIH